MTRKFIGVIAVLIGTYIVVTHQSWGFTLIHWVGPERALGASNVHREPDGAVLMTNPGGMMLWCLPFLLVGVGIIVIGGVLLRGSRSVKSPNTSITSRHGVS